MRKYLKRDTWPRHKRPSRTDKLMAAAQLAWVWFWAGDDAGMALA